MVDCGRICQYTINKRSKQICDFCAFFHFSPPRLCHSHLNAQESSTSSFPASSVSLDAVLPRAVHRRPVHFRLRALRHRRHIRHWRLSTLSSFDVAVASIIILLRLSFRASKTADETDGEHRYERVFDHVAAVDGRAVGLKTLLGCRGG